MAFPSWTLITSGLADDLALLAVATEVGTKGTWAEKVVFRATNKDLFFKKNLLLIISYIAQFESAQAVNLAYLTNRYQNFKYSDQYLKCVRAGSFRYKIILYRRFW